MREINEFTKTASKDLKFVAKPDKNYKGEFSSYKLFAEDYPYTIGYVYIEGERNFKLSGCSDDRIGFEMVRDPRKDLKYTTLEGALEAFKVFYFEARDRAEKRLEEIDALGETEYTKTSEHHEGETMDVSVWKSEGDLFKDWWKVRANLTFGQIFKLLESKNWHVDFEGAYKWIVYAMEDRYSIGHYSGSRVAFSHKLGYRKGFKDE